MKISTKRFGEIEINPNTILTFKNGILGFPKFSKYVLIDPDKRSPLKWMQCVDSPELAFVVTDPTFFISDYEIVVSPADIEDINLEEEKDSVQFVIVTVPHDPSQMTANLKGPIIVNIKNNMAKQLILDDTRYEVKHRLLEDRKKAVNS